MQGIASARGGETVASVREIKAGMIIGALKIVSPLPPRIRKDGVGITVFMVRCDCGKQFEKIGSNIVYDCMRMRGNRCRRCAGLACNTGNRQIPGSMVTNYRNNARTRGIAFNITADDMLAQWNKQGGICVITGIELELPQRVKSKNKTTGIRTVVRTGNASIDRIDSAIGYEPENIWWIHKMLNRMKTDLPLGDFVSLCQLVVGNPEMAKLATPHDELHAADWYLAKLKGGDK